MFHHSSSAVDVDNKQAPETKANSTQQEIKYSFWTYVKAHAFWLFLLVFLILQYITYAHFQSLPASESQPIGDFSLQTPQILQINRIMKFLPSPNVVFLAEAVLRVAHFLGRAITQRWRAAAKKDD